MIENELVEMAQKASGISPKRWDELMKIMQSDADMNAVMREDWKKDPRTNEKAIRNYYKESDIWFINTFCHGKGALLFLANHSPSSWHAWSEEFKKLLGGKKILDYGGGFFNDTWMFAADGCEVTQAEIFGPVTDFLTVFSLKTNHSSTLKILPVENDRPIKDLYDGITCFETLEHVIDPIGLAKHLTNHLKPGGPFAMSVSFGAPEHAPYHVASNAPLSDPKVWKGHLTSMGLEKVWAAQDSHRTIWRKK